jgi:hypothetical protein
MARLKIFGAICAAPIVVIVVAAVVGAISPNLALVWVSVVALLSLYARRSPLPRLGLISKGVANAALIGAVLGVLATFGAYQQAERDRLTALAASDPDAYLTELRRKDEKRWLQELQRLDPSAYQVEIDRRETVRRQEIAALEEEVRGVPASEYERNLRIYERLSELAPDDQRYATKVAYYKEKKVETERQRKHPEEFVQIINFTWRKTGFDNIMEASFTLKSNLPFTVKDIEVLCSHSAPSGTVIDNNRRTIFEILPAQGTLRINDFNMGFIHSQAQRSGCRVTSVSLA